MMADNKSFEQILTATLRMLRGTWKARVALFFQFEDDGHLSIRGADGLGNASWATIRLKASGIIADCLDKNRVVESEGAESLNGLSTLLSFDGNKEEKFVVVPVSGQSKVLGLLLLGPFPRKEPLLARENELRSAGALCAVLSAHWRLHEWMSHFLPQMNHELRTPLTAVQGSLGMVLGGVFGQVGGEVREMLEMAQKGCERTVKAIEEYLSKQDMPKE